MSSNNWLKVALVRFDSVSRNGKSSLVSTTGSVAQHTRNFVATQQSRASSAARYGLCYLMQSVEVNFRLEKDPKWGFPLLVDPAGQPSKNFFISLAHTEGMAAVALASGPVGIDVEERTRNASRVVTQVSTATEWEAARQLMPPPYRSNPALALWLAKEAFGKQRGSGLTWGEGNLEFQVSGTGPHVIFGKPGEPRKIQRSHVTFLEAERFWVAVCATEPNRHQNIQVEYLTAPDSVLGS